MAQTSIPISQSFRWLKSWYKNRKRTRLKRIILYVELQIPNDVF